MKLFCPLVSAAALLGLSLTLAGSEDAAATHVSIVGHRWHLNGAVTYPGTPAEGLLMNVRMVNATFEDRNKPDFDAEANTGEFIARIPDYVAQGVRGFTLCLQGGMPGYEGAINSAFNSDGTLRDDYLRRVRRVIAACDRNGAAVILGLYYQRQSKILQDAEAVRAGVVNVVRWIQSNGFGNVVLEIANEYPHKGFAHPILKTPSGEAELIRLAKATMPGLLVSASGYGDAKLHDEVAEASDFLLIHFNSLKPEQIAPRIEALRRFHKPIVCNEDDRPLAEFPTAAELAVKNGCSHGLMLNTHNQRFPFTFLGAADAPAVYATYRKLTSAAPGQLDPMPLNAKESAAVAPPYPSSPVIAAVEWAPKESIVRRAKDGDNWPVTWADDDALYTTWGDGTGFVPKVEKKLSCGFARVTGSPDNFVGANIRSTAEQLGQGRAGRKGWGILCVEGTLHLWFGHADNQGATMQLAWSRDHAVTWTLADWKFAEFGMVGFVNFGKNYAGARDDFVYAYSHDDPRADTPADRFILMRAPKNRLTERAAWEFFEKLDASGQPVWTRDLGKRGAAFQHPGACLRSAMTYCAPLKRYLWWQHIPQPPGATNDRGDTRFTGGFGIYDAPEPWGPWTTAFFTGQWDVGPGEHGDFPAKWMSADGKTLHLVFSGDDSFSVRRATLMLRK